MSPEQILGWVNVVLSQYGITNAIQVIVYIGVAVYIYKRFLGNRGD